MHSNDNLHGLVLAGGQSNRMGKDKSTLAYHANIQHRKIVYHILMRFCSSVYISCRSDQHHITQDNLSYIMDENLYQGPMNGILSAHHQHPMAAWLVLAIDLPHVNERTVQTLIENRDPEKTATAYATQKSHLPEPLAAIWESKGLLLAEKHLQEKQANCPRKFLMNNDIQLVFPKNDLELFNANFPEDYAKAKNHIMS